MLKILTEGGGKVGFGHIGRCLPIYEAAKKAGIDCELHIATYGDINIGFIEGIKRSDWLKDLSSVDFGTKDLVLIDTLLADEETLLEIERNVKGLFIVDDIGESFYEQFIRVDWSVRSYVQNNSSNKHLVSPALIPLRAGVSKFPKKFNNQHVSRILVTLGGSDIRNLSPIIVESLLNRYPDISVTLFVGPGFKCIDELKNIVSSRFTMLMNPSDKQISTAMIESDLALSPGGHSIYELAAAGLPTVQFMVAENQDVSRYWSDYGFTKYSGKWNDENFIANLMENVDGFLSCEVREASSILGQKLVSGDGASLLVKSIVNYELDNS